MPDFLNATDQGEPQLSTQSVQQGDEWLLSDAELAAASTSGCPDALNEVYRRFYTRVVRLCYLRLGDRSLAEDVAQTTMLRVLRHLPTFDPGRPLWPWLRAIALRRCATLERKRSREVSLQTVTELFEPMPDPCEKVLQSVALQAALERLPARQRLALQLRYLEDMGGQEAAGIIGINRNAFDQLLVRGKNRLAEVFSADHSVRGLGLFALIAFLRRGGRRATDSATSVSSASGPLVGASLAAIAGVAAMLSLEISTGLAAAQPRLRPQVVTSQAQSAAVRGADTSGARSVLKPVAVTRVLGAASAPVLRTYVAPHPLSGGRMDSQRLVIPTPVGTVNVGGGEDLGHGGATLCHALVSVAAAPQCQA